TRLQGDWSSDVCSSDLHQRAKRTHHAYCRTRAYSLIIEHMDLLVVAREAPDLAPTPHEIDDLADARQLLPKLPHGLQIAALVARSEERRVGNERGAGGS